MDWVGLGYRVDGLDWIKKIGPSSNSVLSPVRLSVRRVYHRKTVEVRIMKFSPYGSPNPIVFVGVNFI